MRARVHGPTRYIGLCAVLAVGMSGGHEALAHDIFYQGSAFGVQGTVTAGTVTKKILLADNHMSCQGLPKEETVSTTTHPFPLALTAKGVTTFTDSVDSKAIATSGLAELHLEVPGLTIDATALNANAEASCDENNVVTRTGGSNIGSLMINGEGGELTGAPNQTIEIPGVATIIFNEQTVFSREFRVNAMHIKLLNEPFPASGDIIVANARAKITCTN